MKITPQTDDMRLYYQSTDIIDHDKPEIQDLAIKLCKTGVSEVEQTQITYEFVRDHIRHSEDMIRAKRIITCSASEVLEAGQGLCYGKSHLLAALLRCQRIPCGFCYQLIKKDDNFVLHGLNGVYLREIKKWVRLDARGNKGDINAVFSIGKERLAYTLSRDKREIDHPKVYYEPDQNVISALRRYSDYIELINNLPEQLYTD